MVDNFKDSKKGYNTPVGAFATSQLLAFNTRIMYLSNITRLSNLSNTWSVIKNRAIPV